MHEGVSESPQQDEEKLQLTPEQLEALKKRVERAEKMADLLDKKYLDPIIGLLIPEGGDAVTALAGLYLIYEAKQMDMPASELAKMLGRTGLDWLGGSIPIVGDMFDFVYKSNSANAEAMRKHFENIQNDVADFALKEAELTKKDRGEIEKDLAA